MSVPGGFKASASDATQEEQVLHVCKMYFLGLIPLLSRFVKDILDVVKGQVEAKLGKTFSTFRAVKFNTQVVAGKIYLIKAEVDGGEFVHAKIIKPLPHTGQGPSLMKVEGGHSNDSPLVPL